MNIKKARLKEIASQLVSKAVSVQDGFYGDDDDNDSWAANLRRAADRLRSESFSELNQTDFEEIEFGSDITTEEIESIREN